MLDLNTLESLTDRQILFKLIGLITSLITVQHRDRPPSSTPCRNGPACSFRPRCWFGHAPHPVRHAGTPPSPASPALYQRSVPAWRTPRLRRASAAPSPTCFSSRNAFGSLAPRRRRRRSSGRHRPLPIRLDAPLPPAPSTSSPAPCRRRRQRRLRNDIDHITFEDVQRIATTVQRRRSFNSFTCTEASDSPPLTPSSFSSRSPRSPSPRSPWRPPPRSAPRVFPP